MRAIATSVCGVILVGAALGPIGDTRLPVESVFTTRARIAVLGFLSCTLLVAVAGCHRSPAPDVVATVNGKEIQRADLEKLYKANLGDNPQQPAAEQADIGRLTILHGMIEDEILQQRNMTLEDYKRFLRRSLTSTKLLNKEIESKINITDASISAYYAAHKAEFNLIEPQYHLAWILTTGAPAQQTGNLQNNKASGDADAKKKIQTLHNRLDSGEDFGALAMNFSEDPNTASNGGDRGFVSESQLHSDAEVYNIISKLKPGQITEVLPVFDSSGPGHHTVGYAIYELIAREPAGQRELNDPRVQQTIHTQLHDSRAQLLRNAYFEMLHDEAKVHNYFADQILKEDAQ